MKPRVLSGGRLASTSVPGVGAFRAPPGETRQPGDAEPPAGCPAQAGAPMFRVLCGQAARSLRGNKIPRPIPGGMQVPRTLLRSTATTSSRLTSGVGCSLAVEARAGAPPARPGGLTRRGTGSRHLVVPARRHRSHVLRIPLGVPRTSVRPAGVGRNCSGWPSGASGSAERTARSRAAWIPDRRSCRRVTLRMTAWSCGLVPDFQVEAFIEVAQQFLRHGGEIGSCNDR